MNIHLRQAYATIDHTSMFYIVFISSKTNEHKYCYGVCKHGQKQQKLNFSRRNGWRCRYLLIQKGRRLNLPTDIMLKLFDSCVEPILLYGCEVWGYENVDILEKVHTKFCKFIFGVSKYSHNMPVYGELGRYPLSIKIKQRMVSYWTRILKSSEYKLNKVMYTILYNLHCKNVHLCLVTLD